MANDSGSPVSILQGGHVATVDSLGNLHVNSSGFGVPDADYFKLTQASLTDTWTFRRGGSSGTLLATLVITYTSSAKTTIDFGQWS